MHLLLALASVLLALSARADAPSKIMFSHYLRYQLCMQRQLGNDFYERFRLDHVVNRWGVTEMTQAAAATAPPEVRRLDEKCRQEHELAEQPRPTSTGLVVDPVPGARRR